MRNQREEFEIIEADEFYESSFEEHDENELIEDCQEGKLSFVEILLANPGVRPDAQDNLAIILAAEHGHHKIVQLLLTDPRVSPDAQENQALIIASKNGHHNVVKLLLADPRVSPDAQNNFAIRIASRKGHFEVVQLLSFDNRVNPGDLKNDSLIEASSKGHLAVVKLLLMHPQVNHRDENNEAIKIASSKSYREIVSTLVYKKPSINFFNTAQRKEHIKNFCTSDFPDKDGQKMIVAESMKHSPEFYALFKLISWVTKTCLTKDLVPLIGGMLIAKSVQDIEDEALSLGPLIGR